MMFIDLYDLGNPSRLTIVMQGIDSGTPCKLLVGSRTFSLDLVTDINFRLVLYDSRGFYKCV